VTLTTATTSTYFSTELHSAQRSQQTTQLVQQCTEWLYTCWPDKEALCFAQADTQFQLAAIKRRTLQLDISLQLFTEHQERKKTSFQVTALPRPGDSVCYPPSSPIWLQL